MLKERFEKLSGIRRKLIVMVALPVIAFLLIVFLYILPSIRDAVYEEKRTQTREMVNIGLSILEHHHSQYRAGLVTQEQAKEAAKSAIKSIRYGSSNRDYFWINDFGPRMVMHPFRDDLDGQDISGFADPEGTHLFVEMVRIAREQGAGFVPYLWQYYDEEGRIEPKLSYVATFEPWNWIIGTGIYTNDVNATIAGKRNVILALFVLVSIAVVAGAMWFSGRTIVAPLQRMTRLLEDMARKGGDLTQRLPEHSRDELGALARSFNRFVEKLQEIMLQIRETADSQASASGQVSASAQSLSQGATEQAASVEETTSSVDEMSASIEQNNQNAGITDEISSAAADKAREGGKAVSETVDAMRSIAEKISIIDEIAYQTNLLALNAAIEAARAGDHGKGFAVVASEVRKLAERSQVAAQEIGELAHGSVDLAERAGSLLDEMVPSIEKASGLVKEISAASSEQASGTAQIRDAMEQLNSITQQSASSAEELAATSEEMTGRTEQLQELLAYFTLELENAVSAGHIRQPGTGGSFGGAQQRTPGRSAYAAPAHS